MITIIDTKQLAKEIKTIIKNTFPDIDRLSVKSKGKIVKITWYDKPLESILELVETNIENLIENNYMDVETIEFWRDYSLSYMKENDWMKERRGKTLHIKNTLDRPIENKIDMIATFATINYTGNKVEVIFTNKSKTNTVKLDYKKAWSHKKYIEKAKDETGIIFDFDFKYTWEEKEIV